MFTDPSGMPLARRELLRHVGRLEQVAGIEPFVFDDGPARGARACSRDASPTTRLTS